MIYYFVEATMYTSVIATYIPIYDEVASNMTALECFFRKLWPALKQLFTADLNVFLSFLRSAGEVL